MATQILFRRDTSENWVQANPLLAQGELGLETDTGQFKVGNGSDEWNSLLYASGPRGLRWMGEWDSETEYFERDVVTFSKPTADHASVYFAVSGSSNEFPEEADGTINPSWELFVRGPDDGSVTFKQSVLNAIIFG